MPSFQFPPQLIALQVPLLVLNNVVTLAVGPRYQLLRVFVSAPLLALLVAQSLYVVWDGGWGHQYALNVMVCGMVFQYIDWILLQNPDKEGWYKIQYENEEVGKKTDEGGVENSKRNGNGVVQKRLGYLPCGAGTSFWSRFWWAIRLSFTNRYVGWSNQVKNVNMEVPPTYPRLRFIARKAIRTAIFALFRNFLTCYSASTPHGTWLDLQRQSLKPYQPFPSNPAYPLATRFCYTWLFIMIAFANMEMLMSAYAVLSVALGLANPRDCPCMFGRLGDLWSIRQAWSKVWHQQCRRICSAPAIWLARHALALKTGGFASKYVQLFVAFGVSAIVHAAASMLVHRSWEDDGSFGWLLGRTAAVIMVEDHVIELGKWLGFRDRAAWRVLGFVWTVGMVAWGCEGYVAKTVSHGMWVHEREIDVFGVGPR